MTSSTTTTIHMTTKVCLKRGWEGGEGQPKRLLRDWAYNAFKPSCALKKQRRYKIDVNARGNDVTNFWLNLGSMPSWTYNKKQGVIITLGRKEFVREWKTAQNWSFFYQHVIRKASYAQKGNKKQLDYLNTARHDVTNFWLSSVFQFEFRMQKLVIQISISETPSSMTDLESHSGCSP